MRRPLMTLLALVPPAALFVACFGPAIFRGEQFGFRDAAHYYYPLHRRVQAEWDAGRWPLWMPEENGGMPLLGNPTAAVLYPGKFLFFIANYPLASRLYIMGHTALAFAAMFALARHWGASRAGATLGAMGYAFGGPILYQTCNVVFLVGAAWAPLGFRAADRWLGRGRRIALAELAVVLALQVLGGDPEAAYLTEVCAAGYAVALSWRGRVRVRPAWAVPAASLWVAAALAAERWLPGFRPASKVGAATPPFPWTPWVGPVVAAVWGLAGLVLLARWRRSRDSLASELVPRLGGLAAAAVVAGLLCSAQLLPVMEFIARSSRASAEGTLDIYPFSLAPARVVEFAWPNVFGTAGPGNTLWLGHLPPHNAGANLWVATLSLGSLTLALWPAALVPLGRRGPEQGPLSVLGHRPSVIEIEGESAPWRVWMAAVAAVGLLASLGEYGSPIWLARAGAILPSAGEGALRDGDGGVYWLLATALPGFDRFRYPSKLLTFTALGLAALAARGWDALGSADPRPRRRMAAWSGAWLALSLLALAATFASRGAFLGWLARHGKPSVFGPFDAEGALAEARWGLAQGAVGLGLALGLGLRLRARRPRVAAALALMIAAADLALANGRAVATVPQSVMDAPSAVVAAIERDREAGREPGPHRIHRMPAWNPSGWQDAASRGRVGEIAAWERETAQPKYGINLGLNYTLTLGVAELHDYAGFFGGFHYAARDRAARVLGVPRGTDLIAYPRRAFDLWGARYFILPYASRWDDEFRGIASFIERTERIDPPPGAFLGPGGKAREDAWVKRHDYQVRRNLDAFPRAWVVHEARSLPPVGRMDPAERNRRVEEMLFRNDLSWPDPARVVYDPRLYAWLDDEARARLAAHLGGGYPSPGESARVVAHAPDRVAIDAVLQRPGLVILADTDYPGWTLAIDGTPAPIDRANGMMRAAAVPEGHHTLVYTYRPASFRVGLAGSALGGVVLGLLALRAIAPSFRARKNAPILEGPG